jgi:hypothetical protein
MEGKKHITWLSSSSIEKNENSATQSTVFLHGNRNVVHAMNSCRLLADVGLQRLCET